ncbi:MAG: ExeM/NucH family extracellular endonuclease [Acidobacteria bacterium]|nr:ExeM/NucH family extracellular endonuclease [Acidobacteriota bacterium]
MRPTQNHLTRYFSLIRLSSFLRARSMMAAIVLLPALAFAVYYLASPPAARGVSNSIVISEFRVRGPNGAADEFVEIYNLSGSTVNIGGWKINGSNNAGATSTRATVASGVTLGPGCHFLFTNSSASGGPYSGSTPGNQTYATGITDDGGIALLDASNNVIDQVGMSAGSFYKEGTVLASLGSSNLDRGYERKPGGGSGSGTDTDNNSADFALVTPSAPQNLASPCIAISSPDTAPTVSSTTPTNSAISVSVASNITVTFSEPVNATAASFTISCTSGARTFALSNGPTTFTLDPDTNFGSNESCMVTVLAANVTDQDSSDPPDNMIANYVFSFTTETVEVCGDPATRVHAVQGSGATSPIVGSIVSIEGIVVGDYQGTGQFSGFFVQEEDADVDADPATSEGISIFNTSFPVNVGDKVRVKGTVAEFLSSGQTLTQLSSVTSVQVCSTGNALPTAATVTLPVSNLTDWERYEGMLINIPQNLTVTETFTLGRFGELTLSVNGRLSTPTNIVAPGAPAIAQQALNDRSSIVLDDANNLQNIDPTIYPAGGLSALNTLRSGYTVNGLTGVLEQRFGVYRIQPVGSISFTAGNPRQAAPDAVGGAPKVASFNVLNYFNGNGLGGGFPTSRGANSVTEFNRQRSKIISAIVALNADIVGLMEIENDAAGNSAIEDLVSGLNAATAPGTYTFINTGVVGTDEIRLALIYKPASVTPSGGFAILNSMVDPNFIDTLNRPSLAQTFSLNTNSARLTVVVNHLKSKGSNCNSVGDPDIGDGQDNCNLTRTKAATALVNWLATDPTGSGDPDFIIIGDMNAYAKEDPITAIKNGGYTDLINSLLGANAYSYVFSGGAGYIDHALASSALVPQVAGITEWHINADEPTVLDYNVEFKSANHVNTLFDSGPFRASDHDPVLIGLNLNAPPTISAVGAMQQQGSPSANSTIANVNDVDQAENTLSVKVNGGTSATVNGVTVSNITVDAAGVVKADIVAACTATNASFTLRVTDSGGLFAETTLNVTVSANTPPVLSYAAVQNVIAGNGLTVNPATGPSDNGSVSTIIVQNKGTFTGNVTVNAAGVVTISNAAPLGSHTITIRATDNCNSVTDATFTVAVSAITGSVADPALCTGPGGAVDVTATVTNGANSSQSATFTASLPAGLLAVPGTCSANVGICNVVNGSTVNWSGTLAGNQTVTIKYKAQIGDQVVTGTQLCITSSGTVGGSPAGSVVACLTVNCPALGTGVIPDAKSPASDQKAGSVLFYNIYSSDAANYNAQNTRISITNTHPVLRATVHLFFIDGNSCTAADQYLCLTPNQTYTFLASDIDPGTTGYLVAVAVDDRGCPIDFNYLIGDEYIKLNSGHAANLGAEAISALAGGLPLCDGNSTTATLKFDGASYNGVPRVLAVDNIPAKGDSNETLLILNRFGGDLSAGGSSLGTIFGLLYDDVEQGYSFNITGGCQLRSILSNSFPRTAPRFESAIPPGRTGWMKLYSLSDIGMFGAVINLNKNSNAQSGAFNQGHNLHKLTLTQAATLIIPVFPPRC